MVKRGARGGKKNDSLWILVALAAAVAAGVYFYKRSGAGAASSAPSADSGVVAKAVGADWCGYSKKQQAEMDAIKAKVGAAATVEYHDAETPEGKALVSDNKIGGFPTVIVYKNGVKAGDWSGFAKADDFLKKLESYL